MNVSASRQRGAFLLEALIAILIVALGVLGSVGLLARSIQDMDDAKNRGEAAHLANHVIGQMWVADSTWVADRTTANLNNAYASVPGSGAGYNEFRNLVFQRLPNASLYAQDIVVSAGPMPANLASSMVSITIRWCPPGERVGSVCRGPTDQPHVYNVTAAIGAN